MVMRAYSVMASSSHIHQKKMFRKDRRYKEGGYWIYSCELNDDPFTSHAVNGMDYDACYVISGDVP